MIDAIKLNVTLNSYNYSSILKLNQYDKNIPVYVNLFEKTCVPYTLKSEDVVSIEWAIQGKLGYIQTTNITKGEDFINFLTDRNVTALSGEGFWNIVISSGEDERVASFRIPLVVEKNAVSDDTIEVENIASAIEELQDLLKQAQDQGITGIEVENNLNSTSYVKALAAGQGKILNDKISDILTSLESCGVELVNNDGMLYLLNSDGEQLGTGIDISKINNALVYQTIVAGSDASNKHGIAYNAANTNDKDILHKDITAANGYGVLVNYGCVSSKRIRISDCKVFAKSDAIEINTPGSADDDILEDVIISNNFLKVTDEASTSSTAGFAIGIAQANNVLAVGNVANGAIGGYHVEDAQRNNLAVGNIFDKCKNEGCALYGRTRGLKGDECYARPVIVAGNHFTADTFGTGTGIYNTSTQFGNLAGSIITSNRIEGFNIGANLLGRATVIFDNNLIQRCTLGLVPPDLGSVGKTYFSECTGTLVKLVGGATIDGIIAVDAIGSVQKAIQTSNLGNGSATINEIAWYCPQVSYGSETIKIPLVRAAKYMKGMLKVCMRTSGGHYYRWLGEIELKDGTFTKTEYDTMLSGAFSGCSVYYEPGDDDNFGYIYLGFTSAVGSVTYYTNMHFKGESVWKKGTTNQEANVV